MFENWNPSSKRLVDRLKNDPRSELCMHGAEIYATENMIADAEIRVGWPRHGSDRHDCMGRVFAKIDGSIELRLHVGIESGLISDLGPLQHVTKTKKPDLGMGKVVLSNHYFPDAVFDWIACASRYSRLRHSIPVFDSERILSNSIASELSRRSHAKSDSANEDAEDFDEGQREFWLFNTDETELAGKGKHSRMLKQKIIAAWGYCRGLGAEATLNRPKPGDVIFYFRAGHGIIARAFGNDVFSAPSKSVFREVGEYSRPVSKLQILPESAPVTVAEIKFRSGYQIPYRQIMARILDSKAVTYLNGRFRGVPTDPPQAPRKSGRHSGAFFQNDPEVRAAVEKAAVRIVTDHYEAKDWHVKSVERENVGYDLHCTNGDAVECVEVKGSSGHDQRFIMTANELNKAKSDPRFALYVVTDVLQNPVLHRYRGLQLLKEFKFLPTQFRVEPCREPKFDTQQPWSY